MKRISADEIMTALRINPLSLSACYWNIADAQLASCEQECEARIREMTEVIRLLHDFLDRYNGEYGNREQLCFCCHSNKLAPTIGIEHEDWCPIKKARKYLNLKGETDGKK